MSINHCLDSISIHNRNASCICCLGKQFKLANFVVEKISTTIFNIISGAQKIHFLKTNAHSSMNFPARIFSLSKQKVMYHISLGAYYIFFNFYKVFYFIVLLLMASVSISLLLETVRNLQDTAGSLLCKESIASTHHAFNRSNYGFSFESG